MYDIVVEDGCQEQDPDFWRIVALSKSMLKGGSPTLYVIPVGAL